MTRVFRLVPRVAPAAVLVLAFAASSPAQSGRIAGRRAEATRQRVSRRARHLEPARARFGARDVAPDRAGRPERRGDLPAREAAQGADAGAAARTTDVRVAHRGRAAQARAAPVRLPARRSPPAPRAPEPRRPSAASDACARAPERPRATASRTREIPAGTELDVRLSNGAQLGDGAGGGPVRGHDRRRTSSSTAARWCRPAPVARGVVSVRSMPAGAHSSGRRR